MKKLEDDKCTTIIAFFQSVFTPKLLEHGIEVRKCTLKAAPKASINRTATSYKLIIPIWVILFYYNVTQNTDTLSLCSLNKLSDSTNDIFMTFHNKSYLQNLAKQKRQ